MWSLGMKDLIIHATLIEIYFPTRTALSTLLRLVWFKIKDAFCQHKKKFETSWKHVKKIQWGPSSKQLISSS